ncbi:MAG: response regulator transcription factor [Acidobacteriota bacterium]
MEKSVLISDDSEGIVDILSTYLIKEGFAVIPAFDGEEALEKFHSYNPVIILLDIMMPKKDGLGVLQEIRKTSNTPVLMITARGEDGDKIMGLDYGADDYIVKPFSPGEVMARIRAILRRIDVTEEQKRNILRFPGLEVNIDQYQVKVNGSEANLTKKEIEILWLLGSNPNKVFSRDNLLNSIWGFDYYGDPRAVDTHIKRIRAKLDITDQYTWDIKTIWGVGYKFEVKHAKE